MFDGNARWLEIAVEGQGENSFTTLSPRTPMLATPYALYALNASGGGLTLPYAGTGATNGTLFSLTNSTAGGSGIAIQSDNTAGSFTGTGAVSYGITATGLTCGVSGTGDTQGVYGGATSGYGVEGKYGYSVFVPVGDKAGVFGHTSSSNPASAGVRGENSYGFGVQGTSSAGIGVSGKSSTNFGVYGSSNGNNMAGVFGQTSFDNQAGVLGRNESSGPDAQGVYGYASSGAIGVLGISEGNDGTVGRSNASGKSGVFGYSTAIDGFGGYFLNTAGGVALHAEGLAQVKTLQILGADLAESFPVQGAVEPGTVLMIEGDGDGTLRVCDEAYSHRVAGVVSGANGLDAAVVLKGRAFDESGHAAVAMSGRVWVRCDANAGPIRPGDLLTSSGHAGCAMRAADRERAYGAILGKAMTSLETGTGLVLVLVNLQ